MASRPPMHEFSNTGPPSLPPTNRTTPDSGFGNGTDSDMTKKVPPGFTNMGNSHLPHSGNPSFVPNPVMNGNQFYGSGPGPHAGDSHSNVPPKQLQLHHMGGSFEDPMNTPNNMGHQVPPAPYYGQLQMTSMGGQPIQRNPYQEYTESHHLQSHGYGVPIHPGMRGPIPVPGGPGPSVSQGGVSSNYAGNEGDPNANGHMHHVPQGAYQHHFQPPVQPYPPQQQQPAMNGLSSAAGPPIYMGHPGQPGHIMTGPHPQMVQQNTQMMPMPMIPQSVPMQTPPPNNAMVQAFIQGPNGQVQQILVPANSQQGQMLRQHHHQQMGVVAGGNASNGYLQFAEAFQYPQGAVVYRQPLNKVPSVPSGPNSQTGIDGDMQQHPHSSGPPSTISLPGSMPSGISHPPPQQGQPMSLMQMSIGPQQTHNRPVMLPNQNIHYYATPGMVPMQYSAQGPYVVPPQQYQYAGSLNRNRAQGGNRSFRGSNTSFRKNNSERDKDAYSSASATPHRSQAQTPVTEESTENREMIDKEAESLAVMVDGVSLSDKEVKDESPPTPNRRSPKEMLQLVEKPTTPRSERESPSPKENKKEEVVLAKESSEVDKRDPEEFRAQGPYCSYCHYVGKPDADKHVLRDQNYTCERFTTDYSCRNCGSHGHVEMKCPTKVPDSFLESQRKLTVEIDREFARREEKESRGYNKSYDNRDTSDLYHGGEIGGFSRYNQNQGSYRHNKEGTYRTRNPGRGTLRH